MAFRKRAHSHQVARLLAMSIVTLLTGCFAPAFSPGGVEQPGQVGADACAKIVSARPEGVSLRVLADATLRRGSEAVSFRYAIVRKAPDSFRVDILPPTGAFTVGLFVFHEGRAIWLDSTEKRYIEVSGEGDLFERFIGLPGITRPVVEGLLLGVVPPLDCAQARVYRQEGGDVLLVDSESHIAWRVIEGTPKIREVSILNRSEQSVAVRGEIERAADGKPMRLLLSVFDPVEAQGELILTKVVENPSISERLFEITPPPNYERVD